ncbi:hypothetical protein FRX31_010047 [Thalictrum thalictroides]|uniref:Uncharacterized protein n=1 Tax=Thalictrum thalictroides TaxID=46969 RepID=A0A7J6WSL4_THATH|nr:hypothetical protein FRX31_010047 [Thalictrum thalictroides]
MKDCTEINDKRAQNGEDFVYYEVRIVVRSVPTPRYVVGCTAWLGNEKFLWWIAGVTAGWVLREIGREHSIRCALCRGLYSYKLDTQWFKEQI